MTHITAEQIKKAVTALDAAPVPPVVIVSQAMWDFVQAQNIRLPSNWRLDPVFSYKPSKHRTQVRV